MLIRTLSLYIKGSVRIRGLNTLVRGYPLFTDNTKTVPQLIKAYPDTTEIVHKAFIYNLLLNAA